MRKQLQESTLQTCLYAYFIPFRYFLCLSSTSKIMGKLSLVRCLNSAGELENKKSQTFDETFYQTPLSLAYNFTAR